MILQQHPETGRTKKRSQGEIDINGFDALLHRSQHLDLEIVRRQTVNAPGQQEFQAVAGDFLFDFHELVGLSLGYLTGLTAGVQIKSPPIAVLLPWGNLIEISVVPPQTFLMQSVFTGPVYVVRDNIDTDQIISAQYLNLVPTIPEEYEKLGSYALAGLPESLYSTRYVKEGQLDSDFPIVVAGRNFGCGSSREHAPIAMGSAKCRLVLAESFARIFFRNCVATGELYPCEATKRLCDVLKTGDVVTVDLDAATVTVKNTDQVYHFKPLGDVRPVVDAGGIFNYARNSGMIAK
jgi:3-isopropylmalate/(R)-2-methylmalate dehydratase small subunit